jgi:hypothetical protein
MSKTLHYTLHGINHTVPYETTTIPDHMMERDNHTNHTFTTTYDFAPLLSLLRVWIELAARHNITYWAVDGTLLGCLRHQGIIPWDNDVDLCIKYDQYEMIRSIDFGEFEVVEQMSGFQFRARGTMMPFIDLFAYEVEPGTDMLVNCLPVHPVTHELTFYAKIGNKMVFRPEDLVDMGVLPFEDMEIPVPHHAVETVQRVYGDDAMTHLYYDNHVENHNPIMLWLYLNIPWNEITRYSYLMGLGPTDVPAHNLELVLSTWVIYEFLVHHTRDMDDINKSISHMVGLAQPFLRHHLTKWM